MTVDTELPLDPTFPWIRVSLDTTLLTCLVLQAPHLVINNSVYLVRFFHSSLACQGDILAVLFLITKKKICRPLFVSMGGTAN